MMIHLTNLQPEFFTPSALKLLKANFHYSEAPAAETEILISALKFPLDQRLLSQMPELKTVATPTTGTDHIDAGYCQGRNISIVCLKGEKDFLDTLNATAELTWSLILHSMRPTSSAMAAVKNYQWNRLDFPGNELRGKKIGIVGLGRLGSKVARYARAFEMECYFYDPFVDQQNALAKPLPLKELCQSCDFVSIHVHLTHETRHLVGKNEIAAMTEKTWLINTARSDIVDEKALIDALTNRSIAGAAVDVISGEGQKKGDWPRNHPLINYANNNNNLLITPHMGGLTRESMDRAGDYLVSMILNAET